MALSHENLSDAEGDDDEDDGIEWEEDYYTKIDSFRTRKSTISTLYSSSTETAPTSSKRSFSVKNLLDTFKFISTAARAELYEAIDSEPEDSDTTSDDTDDDPEATPKPKYTPSFAPQVPYIILTPPEDDAPIIPYLPVGEVPQFTDFYDQIQSDWYDDFYNPKIRTKNLKPFPRGPLYWTPPTNSRLSSSSFRRADDFDYDPNGDMEELGFIPVEWLGVPTIKIISPDTDEGMPVDLDGACV